MAAERTQLSTPGQLPGKREQHKSEVDDARRKVESLQREMEELQRELEKLKDRSGFESFFSRLFGSDGGSGSQDSKIAQMYDGATATRFPRDPD